jgi:hypothetical protein
MLEKTNYKITRKIQCRTEANKENLILISWFPKAEKIISHPPHPVKIEEVSL